MDPSMSSNFAPTSPAGFGQGRVTDQPLRQGPAAVSRGYWERNGGPYVE